MCFSKGPEAPINKPSYAPEDSYTQFDSEVIEKDGSKRKLPKPSSGSVPINTVRM